MDSATGYELLDGRYSDPQTARYTQPASSASLLEPLTWNAYPLARDNAFNPAGAQDGSGASDVAPGNGDNGWRPLASLAWVLGASVNMGEIGSGLLDMGSGMIYFWGGVLGVVGTAEVPPLEGPALAIAIISIPIGLGEQGKGLHEIYQGLGSPALNPAGRQYPPGL